MSQILRQFIGKIRSHKSMALIVGIVGLLVVLAGSVGVTRAVKRNPSNKVDTELRTPILRTTNLQTPISPTSKRAIEGEVVRLTMRGFEPKEITRPQGRFLLVLSNQSGIDAPIQLPSQTGNRGRWREMRLKKTKAVEGQVVDLSPGEYSMSVVGHPDWALKFTITEQ